MLPDAALLGDRMRPLLDGGIGVKGSALQPGLSLAVSAADLMPGAFPSSALPAKLPDLYERVRPSVYIVAKPYLCDKCHHVHFQSATAFAINDSGVLATDYHVVAGDYATMAMVDSEGGIHPVLETLTGNKEDDLALVRIDGKTKPLPVAGRAAVGTHVAVVSHPATRFYTLTDGIISQYEGEGGAGAPRVAITAEYAVGSSGAPVVDDTGCVVAIAAATMPVHADAEKKTLQMVVKRCIPADALVRMAGHRS
jgi:S1-C subfamily serine protease